MILLLSCLVSVIVMCDLLMVVGFVMIMMWFFCVFCNFLDDWFMLLFSCLVNFKYFMCLFDFFDDDDNFLLVVLMICNNVSCVCCFLFFIVVIDDDDDVVCIFSSFCVVVIFVILIVFWYCCCCSYLSLFFDVINFLLWLDKVYVEDVYIVVFWVYMNLRWL